MTVHMKVTRRLLMTKKRIKHYHINIIDLIEPYKMTDNVAPLAAVTEKCCQGAIDLHIPICNISIKNYYVGTIPHPQNILFPVLGIKYVHVVAPLSAAATVKDYYIYEKELTKVVEALKLYV